MTVDPMTNSGNPGLENTIVAETRVPEQADSSLVGPQSADEPVDAWDDDELEPSSLFASDESTAFLGSLLFHLILLLSLALVPLAISSDEDAVVLLSPPQEDFVEPVDWIDEVTYSDFLQDEIGINSDSDLAMAEASAEMFAELPEIPNPIDLEPTESGQIMVEKLFTPAVAPLDKMTNQKGHVGHGTEGAKGAVDRITFEILHALEERPTLVVWMFDQSGSLHRQRDEIRNRFDRIYTELGIAKRSEVDAFRRNSNDIPLLTSVIGFGSKVTLFTEEPVEDLDDIKSIVQDIPVDSSGQERVFTAILSATEKYKSYRRPRGQLGPQRNVLFVVVTDERGDDAGMLETSIRSCRKWGIPVYVIGVPAPFGRETTLVKYVDPDPNFDQTPQWAQVDQGPETYYPERVQVGFTGDFKEEPVIDSGFGPYALTRLCYETNGIYFTVHPNRNVNRRVRSFEIESFASDMKYFFDPAAMSRYRPDYLAADDYVNKVKSSPLRQALVSAAQMRPATGLSRPRTRFVMQSASGLAEELTTAQQQAARLEPMLVQIAAILEPGMKARETETSLRWQAGFDLAMGRVLAQKVRTETYNAMLAKAKRGMPFEKPENNTWVLEPSDEISVGSKWEREAALAKTLLEGVVQKHEGTPWALLANQELVVPIGWKWQEEFTKIEPPERRNPGNNNDNNNAPPQDDQRRMIQRAPSRPVPKL
ncbi:vWA domain-containing protein [Novipirellula artificiosorum]|uniref:VWFA domain-containing protein n=1 Tax=Novipirellula artificiosorum TaxID=2528016 RepID=A0A5C6DN48_9BACT|nr:vWA domain-containing protein [Novipirellula artificiosorum]TWU37081.1 hypothetical protein Poly41_32080 [Novipirellula artificiosorum]